MQPAAHGANGASIGGRATADGAVGLDVSTATAGGTVSGRLRPMAGTGAWRVFHAVRGPVDRPAAGEPYRPGRVVIRARPV